METFKEQNEQINQLGNREEERIRKCLVAYKATHSCLKHCLVSDEKHHKHGHITLLKECSEITNLTSSFLLEGSDFKNQICNLCAQICIECAESCEAIDPHDQKMSDCARSCRECAESCMSMLH
jgi:hypothetical protein